MGMYTKFMPIMPGLKWAVHAGDVTLAKTPAMSLLVLGPTGQGLNFIFD